MIIEYNHTQEFSTFHANYDCFIIQFCVNLHIYIIFQAKNAKVSEQIIIDNQSVSINRLSIMIFEQILSTRSQHAG